MIILFSSNLSYESKESCIHHLRDNFLPEYNAGFVIIFLLLPSLNLIITLMSDGSVFLITTTLKVIRCNLPLALSC